MFEAGSVYLVVPLVGTWIEMCHIELKRPTVESCPSWARGLKFVHNASKADANVVPLVGTWIEIIYFVSNEAPGAVVPLVGTWIEIAESCISS